MLNQFPNALQKRSVYKTAKTPDFAWYNIGSIYRTGPFVMLRFFLYSLLAIVLLVGGAVFGVVQYLSPEDEGPKLASPSSTRTISSGRIIGYQSPGGAHAWLGIPYADAARWRAPRPKVPWADRRETLDYGPQCPQLPAVPDSDTGRGYVGEENCLSLNVWAPPHHPDTVSAGEERLPVMVWIHGGGNTIGSSGSEILKAYDGSVMATENEVIVVSVNYRLGPLGWFLHPAIEGTAPTPGDASGNFGTLDLIQALGWVHQNISRFGGDPGNVTIYGESAGGYNVLSLMASPLARGLFHRAIVQSGDLRVYSRDEAMNRKWNSQGRDMWGSRKMVGQWLIDQGRAADMDTALELQDSMDEAELAAWLRSLSVAELYSIFDADFAGMIEMPLILGDGYVIPAMTTAQIFADPNNFSRVPMMIGSNRDEMRLFMAFLPDYVETTGGFPTKIRDVDVFHRDTRYATDFWRAQGVDAIAEAVSLHQDVYAYRFDADDWRNLGFIDFKDLFGAAHVFEIPFIFGYFPEPSRLVFPDSTMDELELLSGSMMSYWAAFAYNGNPAKGMTGEETPWLPWRQQDSGHNMLLDTESDGGIRMTQEIVRLEEVKADFMSDTSFASSEEKCRTYRNVYWGDLYDPYEYESLGCR